jgi:uncharacterized membrane protein
MTWRGDITPIDRFWGSLPYLLPLVTVLPFGLELLQYLPFLAIVFQVLAPLLYILSFFGGGYRSLILFFLLFFLIVRNPRIKHFIRFNTMQAILVDIACVLIMIVMRFFGMIGLPVGLFATTIGSTLFLGVVAITVYACIQNGRGRYAEIPVISEATYLQIRD